MADFPVVLQSDLAERDRYQASTTPGGGKNLVAGDTNNAIAADVIDATIAGGGHSTRENVIGGNTANVNTANSNLPATTGIGASFATIGGGYDNVNNALAGTIAGGAHHKHETGSTHGTIGGGSLNSVLADSDYGTIAGGSSNTVSADSATVGGGTTNAASGLSSTVGGGSTNQATGATSTVAGGTLNKATGSSATVGGGTSNEAKQGSATVAGGNTNVITSGNFATIGGGFSNDVGATTNADYSTIAGGRDNSTQEDYAAIGGGQDNIVSAQFGHIPGGHSNSVSAANAEAGGEYASAKLVGAHTRASGRFAALGDAQTSVVVARIQTTSATPAALRLDSINTRIVIGDNTTWAFSALIVARRTDADNESAAYKVEGCMDRNTGFATAAFVGTPTVTTIAEDTAAWGVAVSVVSGALEITCTGEAAKTINWVARVTLVEVTG